MKPTILFRRDFETEEEYQACHQVFGNNVICRRGIVPGDSLVIGRYSVLPYYKELEEDLWDKDSKLINSFRQHSWIADFHWYDNLKSFTFETWDDWTFSNAPEQAYVVKGKTNSRKHQWNRLCFAADKKTALEIAQELCTDPFFTDQGIIYRKYIPLNTFEIGINGLPFANEYRFFMLGPTILDAGYYWSIADRADLVSTVPQEAKELALTVGCIASQYANFYVLDIAQTEEGDWILVEINDAQCAGLSMINPVHFYSRLKEELEQLSSSDKV